MKRSAVPPPYGVPASALEVEQLSRSINTRAGANGAHAQIVLTCLLKTARRQVLSRCVIRSWQIGLEAGIRTPIPWSRERCTGFGALRFVQFQPVSLATPRSASVCSAALPCNVSHCVSPSREIADGPMRAPAHRSHQRGWGSHCTSKSCSPASGLISGSPVNSVARNSSAVATAKASAYAMA